jgi:hypothetical protein
MVTFISFFCGVKSLLIHHKSLVAGIEISHVHVIQTGSGGLCSLCSDGTMSSCPCKQGKAAGSYGIMFFNDALSCQDYVSLVTNG